MKMLASFLLHVAPRIHYKIKCIEWDYAVMAILPT